MKRIDVISPGLYELRHDGRSIAVEVVSEPARDDEGRVADRPPTLVPYGLPENVTLERVWPSLREVSRERFDALRAAARANDVGEAAQEAAAVFDAAAQVVEARAMASALADAMDARTTPHLCAVADIEAECLPEIERWRAQACDAQGPIDAYLAKHGTLPRSDSTAYALGIRETRRVVVADVSAVSAEFLMPDVKAAEAYAQQTGALPAGFAYQITRKAVVSRRNGGKS